MLWLYRLLFLPMLLVLAPRYLWRMRKRGGYRHNFRQRFGLGHRLPPKRFGVRRVWFQAVSVGEMLAIAPLLEAFRRDASVEVYLTTTTSTGHRLADDRYHGMVEGIGYFPIDCWLFSVIAWRAIQPDMVILTEGERWPEHVHQAKRRGVPVLSVNARLSDRSFRRLKRFPAVSRLVLGGIDRLLPCSTQDEARFRDLGLPEETLELTGNIKLDVTISRLTEQERLTLRHELGLRPGLVLLGSSTWPGEERVLVEAWRKLHDAGSHVALVLVPRHAERRLELERLMRELGVSFHLRSRGAAPHEVDVSIADTTGELRKVTQLADLVFVGKSLPPNDGGQTPVEAAALEKPLLYGPQMSNFRAIARELVASGAAQAVGSAEELQQAIVRLMQDSGARERMAAAAGVWHRGNAGAVARTLAAIRAQLAQIPST